MRKTELSREVGLWFMWSCEAKDCPSKVTQTEAKEPCLCIPASIDIACRQSPGRSYNLYEPAPFGWGQFLGRNPAVSYEQPTLGAAWGISSSGLKGISEHYITTSTMNVYEYLVKLICFHIIIKIEMCSKVGLWEGGMQRAYGNSILSTLLWTWNCSKK